MLTDSAVGPAMCSQLQYLSQFVTGMDTVANNAAVPTVPSTSDSKCIAWTMQLRDHGFMDSKYVHGHARRTDSDAASAAVPHFLRSLTV